MDSVTPWISALAERCLSFYLGRSDNGIQVEDVGGCLSFSFSEIEQRTAIVANVRYTFEMHTGEKRY